ncbi:hypothetical protein KR084_011571 [Drosophila pseudotakahashii]|nr:hypothetical protein KR084_011571 [Drosophila pseudotakahashii]
MSENEEYEYRPWGYSTRSPSPPAGTMSANEEYEYRPWSAEGFEERCVQESRAWTPDPASSTDDSSVGRDGRFATGGPPVPLQCSIAEANDAWADYAARPRTPTASTASREADATEDSFMGTSVSGSLSDDADAEAVTAEPHQIDEGEEGTDPTPNCTTTPETQPEEAEARTPSPHTTAAQNEPRLGKRYIYTKEKKRTRERK